jgi:hypothetical protein
LVVIKESVEEITGREAESTLKDGGKHHNFFAGGRAPLQHGTVWEKVVHNKFVNLTFIYNGELKQMRVRGDHFWEEALLRRGTNTSEVTEIVKRKKRNGGGMRNG